MKQQVNIRLEKIQIKKLDAEAKTQHRTRTNMIELIVDNYLSKPSKAK